VLRALDVLWVEDDLIRPPGPKMVVCVNPEAGLFFRINTRGWRSGSVPIAQADHTFLRHDSHIECGAPFELDDYLIDQSLSHGKGVIGRIKVELVPMLLAEVARARTLSNRDKQAIREGLANA
jgi:hypothetical protein